MHICIIIDDEIKRIAKGKGCLSGSVSEQMIELNKAKREGKKYFSGCDNMDETGRCAGHPCII
jgi:hypothetical protein